MIKQERAAFAPCSISLKIKRIREKKYINSFQRGIYYWSGSSTEKSISIFGPLNPLNEEKKSTGQRACQDGDGIKITWRPASAQKQSVVCVCVCMFSCVWMPLMDKTEAGGGGGGSVNSAPSGPRCWVVIPLTHTLLTLAFPVFLVKDIKWTQPKGTNMSEQVAGS